MGPALYMSLHLRPSTRSGAAAGVSANAMTGRDGGEEEEDDEVKEVKEVEVEEEGGDNGA